MAILFFCVGAGRVTAEDGTVLSKDGVKIAYSVYGEGEPALVFIHGWGGDRSVWKYQVPYFDKKYKVITIDLGGFGLSGKERALYSMKAFGEDVAAVVNKVNPSKVILFGHSMSGVIIFEAAARMPDKVIAVVGIDTIHDFEWRGTPDDIEKRIKPFQENFQKTADSFIRGMFVKGTDPKLIDEIAGKISSTDPKVGISSMEELMKTSYVDLPRTEAQVWALDSDFWPVNMEHNRKYVPGFELRIMPGLGHFIMLEAPDAFNEQLDKMIGEIIKRNKK